MEVSNRQDQGCSGPNCYNNIIINLWNSFSLILSVSLGKRCKVSMP